jgi:hypothetical protein
MIYGIFSTGNIIKSNIGNLNIRSDYHGKEKTDTSNAHRDFFGQN